MLYLDAAATRAALPMPAAIESMEVAFGDDREAPLRTLLGGSLFMPGRAGPDSGVKVVSVVPGNPVGIVVVVGADGSPVGLVDGPALTAIRTGAGAGLATRLFSRTEARVLAAEGKRAEAVQRAQAVRERMRSRQLRALEFEADLAVAEIAADDTAATRLASRAERAGFRLVARKAHALVAANRPEFTPAIEKARRSAPSGTFTYAQSWGPGSTMA